MNFKLFLSSVLLTMLLLIGERKKNSEKYLTFEDDLKIRLIRADQKPIKFYLYSKERKVIFFSDKVDPINEVIIPRDSIELYKDLDISFGLRFKNYKVNNIFASDKIFFQDSISRENCYLNTRSISLSDLDNTTNLFCVNFLIRRYYGKQVDKCNCNEN
jgi:hypothetical protein